MTRWWLAITLALLIAIPSAQSASAESASVAVSVTVLPSPLQAWVEPGCQFEVTKKAKTVECTTTIIVAQNTFQFDGWAMSLGADSIFDPETGRTLPAKSLRLLSYSAFHVYWGQPVDPAGGPFFPANALDQAMNKDRTVIAAKPGFGIGGYETTVRFRLTVPKNAKPGTYVPTFTVGTSNTFDGGDGHGHGDGGYDGHDDDDGNGHTDGQDRDKRRE